MAIKFSCPHCQKALSVKDHLAGKKVQCPACKKPLTIPAGGRILQSRPVDVEALAAAALAEEAKAPAPVVEQATIEFKCYYCDEQVRVSAELAGKQTPCPECRRIIKVPLLQKNQPKDWRTVDTRLPAGARRDVGPAPEGAWDTAAVGVSRQALIEAQVIPQARRRLTVGQWIKRGVAVAAGVLVVVGATWMGIRYLAAKRQDQLLAKALQYLEPAGKLSPEAVAEIHRGAGVYAIRTRSRGSAERARNHFQQARAAILQAARLEPIEREAALIHLAQAQIDLGGEKSDIEQETRLPWDEANKEIRQTLENVSTSEGRAEALRQVTRKFLAKNQGASAVALTSLFPEEGPELLATVGLEMLHAKQEQMAETLANLALEKAAPQALAPQAPPPEGDGKPSAVPPAPSLIALWVALGKPDKVAAVAPPAAAEKVRDLLILLGNVKGLAVQGNFEQARARLAPIEAPEDRLPLLIALVATAADNGQATAVRPDLESALNLTESNLKAQSVSPWQLLRLARAGVKAGLTERVQAVTRLVPDAATRGRMQLEVLRGRLADSKQRTDEAGMKIVDANTPAHAEALEMLARHDAGLGSATEVQKGIEGWEDKLKPLGYLGVALGLQDRNQ
jgi:ribosomal protein S27E